MGRYTVGGCFEMKFAGLSTKAERDTKARRIKSKSKDFSGRSEKFAKESAQRLNVFCRRFK